MMGTGAQKPDKARRKRSTLMTRDVERAFERFEEAWFNFHRYDKDSSGSIDIKELGGLLSDLKLHVGRANRTEHQMYEWVQRELRRSDVNGDGVLSFEEFLDYYNKFVARHRSQCAELYNVTDHVLGSGAFGVVLRGTRVDNGHGVAVKRLVKEKIQDSVALLHNEIAVWEALDHPHLVKLLDVFEDPEHLMLITEICAGDLFTRLRHAPDGRFSETDASRLSSQIVSGVAYLHAHGVVHCDLKPSNILVVQSEEACALDSLTVKVADFGLAQTIQIGGSRGGFGSSGGSGGSSGGGDGAGANSGVDEPGASSSCLGGDSASRLVRDERSAKDGERETEEGDQGADLHRERPPALIGGAAKPAKKALKVVCGTPNYFAPELVLLAQQHLDATDYDGAVDNWALGCVIYELLIGMPPFQASDEEILFYKILENQPSFQPSVSHTATQLIRALLHSDPHERLSAGDALRHTWLVGAIVRSIR